MQQVRVSLGKKSYDIRIGHGALASADGWLRELGFSGRLVIITDDTVRKLYGDRLTADLKSAGREVTLLSVPAGEAQKSLDTAGGLYRQLVEARAERQTPVLALGGGVIGDMAGFVAATYQRGVPLVQVPTTLLAQVDSSIGGKVAVDVGQLKNMAGTFYQPRLVITDTAVLRTLPPNELANGLAEVIKSAAIRDAPFFQYLEENMAKAKKLEEHVIEQVVFRTAGIKAAVVSEDETDTGLRNILNFGHTVGHAIEAVSGFAVPHGHAIAVGMTAAARISRRMGLLKEEEAERLLSLIEAAGLPNSLPGMDAKAVLAAMQHDKKVRDGKMRFVLLRSIGDAFVTADVSPEMVKEVLSGEA
ncbi:MAG: 3-dehydroquinate synthase [Chloroflexota bacterium]